MLVDYATAAATERGTHVVTEENAKCILVDPVATSYHPMEQRLRASSDRRSFPGIPDELLRTSTAEDSLSVDISAADPREGRFSFDVPQKGTYRGYMDSRRAMEKHSPEAVCWLRFAPPRYSEDGTLALIWIHVFPSPHGIDVSYVLWNDGGEWTVVAKQVLYLM